MPSDDGVGKQPANDAESEALKAIIEARDAKYLSPVERGMSLYKLLQEKFPEVTTWDLTCFSAYWLVTQVPQYPFVRKEVTFLARLLTYAHYQMDEANLVTTLPRPEIEQLNSTPKEPT